MFSLSENDLHANILGCADGPASFNSEMTRRGNRVTSSDPLYQFSSEQIRARIDQTSRLLVDQAAQNAHLFVWDHIRSPVELLQVRMQAMENFLADYSIGLSAGRYINQSLPDLNFPDQCFGLALCSHFLFLYSDELPLGFHIAAVAEMCRAAREVRIFPLLDMRAETSIHLMPVINHLRQVGFTAQIEKVEYEFQRGGNRMLRIRPSGSQP